jgi:hypothetical protein
VIVSLAERPLASVTVTVTWWYVIPHPPPLSP